MYKFRKTKNNLSIITAPIQGTKTITILVMVATGSKYENRKNNGISHFVEHMLFKGTAKRPNAMHLSSELDSMGAEFNAFTSKEYTGFYVKADANFYKSALDILSDMIVNSKFDPEEIDRERGVIIEEINMYEDNPMMHIEDVFEEKLYGDSPAGWETIGTKKIVSKVKQKDFLAYMHSQYCAANMTICLAGKINAQMADEAEKYFANVMKSEVKNKLVVRESQNKPEVLIKFKQTDQVHLALGVRGFAYDHPDKQIIKFLSIVLGGSMSSRLFINLRERNGLAYYVRTNCETYTDSGYLCTFAGVPVEKIDQAIRIILEEYKKLTLELIDKNELQRNKDLICGRSTLQLEPSENMASWYGRQMIMNLTLKRENKKQPQTIEPEEFFAAVKKIKPSDLKRVAKNIFVNQGLNLAMIGPFKDKKRFEKIVRF